MESKEEYAEGEIKKKRRERGAVAGGGGGEVEEGPSECDGRQELDAVGT